MSRWTLWRAGGIGDVLLTIPTITELRRLEPDADITLYGHQQAIELLLDAGLVDHIHPPTSGLPRNYASTLELLGRFPTVYDEEYKARFRRLLNDPETMLVWSANPREASVALTAMDIPRVITEAMQPPTAVHQAEHTIATLRNAGILADWSYNRGVERLRLPYTLQNGILPTAFSRSRTVILHPGATMGWKRWPLDGWQALAEELVRTGWQVFILQDDNYRGKFPTSYLIPPITLRQAAKVLESRLPFIGNDSGITHLAAIMGCPTVALFGPTSPACWRPIGNVEIVYRCTSGLVGSDRTCSDGDCMLSISVVDVVRALEDVRERSV